MASNGFGYDYEDLGDGTIDELLKEMGGMQFRSQMGGAFGTPRRRGRGGGAAAAAQAATEARIAGDLRTSRVPAPSTGKLDLGISTAKIPYRPPTGGPDDQGVAQATTPDGSPILPVAEDRESAAVFPKPDYSKADEYARKKDEWAAKVGTGFFRGDNENYQNNVLLFARLEAKARQRADADAHGQWSAIQDKRAAEAARAQLTRPSVSLYNKPENAGGLVALGVQRDPRTGFVTPLYDMTEKTVERPVTLTDPKAQAVMGGGFEEETRTAPREWPEKPHEPEAPAHAGVILDGKGNASLPYFDGETGTWKLQTFPGAGKAEHTGEEKPLYRPKDILDETRRRVAAESKVPNSDGGGGFTVVEVSAERRNQILQEVLDEARWLAETAKTGKTPDWTPGVQLGRSFGTGLDSPSGPALQASHGRGTLPPMADPTAQAGPTDEAAPVEKGGMRIFTGNTPPPGEKLGTFVRDRETGALVLKSGTEVVRWEKDANGNPVPLLTYDPRKPRGQRITLD